MTIQIPQKIKLSINTNIFNRIYYKVLFPAKQFIVIVFGGSASGKSYSMAQKVVNDVLQGDNWLICRKVQNTVKRSVFNEVKKAIAAFKISQYFTINSTELTITCVLNGMQILFTGLDDPEKVKSITPAKGIITKIWVEEATECDMADIKQLRKRLRGLSSRVKQLFLSFNPIFKSHWIYDMFFKGKFDDSKQIYQDDHLFILKTTYKDNRFLTAEDIYELENEPDQYYKDVYTYGNWGVLGNVIFKNWEVRELTDEFIDTLPSFNNGLDWGYSKCPLFALKTHFDKKNKTIYIIDEICETGLTNDEAEPLVRAMFGKDVIFCDSAEPKSIQDFQNRGISAVGVKKGKDSILYGIKWLQQYKIVINKKCINFQNQIMKYKWLEDKNGNVLPKPVEKDDDGIDALRYAYESINDTDSYVPEAPKKTIDDVKKLPFLSPERIELEDELHVIWSGNNILTLDYQEQVDDVTGI